MSEQVLSGRYRIVRHLARGGMAEVYLGHDDLLDRTVAIKVLFPELSRDESFVERFRREARSAAGLNHHNIVSVYDFGEDDGAYFIVMEYVEGETLRDIIRREGPMGPAGAIQIGAEIAAALAAAHAQDIVHRDVKPANVLISGPTVKVADFGIARAANALQGLTVPGTVIGTATYLSPEQAQGGDVDARSDIYSLGMVLYEMLVGKPPFSGDTPVAVAYKQLHEVPVAPSTHNSRVPPALDAIVLKAMAKAPAARFGSADELRAALLSASPAAGDPDATAAIVAGAGTATQIQAQPAGPSTSVLQPGPRSAPDAAVRRGPPSPEVVRRRRAAVIALVALVALGVILVVAKAATHGKTRAIVVAPNVVGKSVADATASLQSFGLTASVVEQDRPGTAGQVVDQDPKGDTVVSKGTTVTLFVPRSAATTTSTAGRPATTVAPPTEVPTTTRAPTSTQAPSTTARPPVTTAPATTAVPTTVVTSTTL